MAFVSRRSQSTPAVLPLASSHHLVFFRYVDWLELESLAKNIDRRHARGKSRVSGTQSHYTSCVSVHLHEDRAAAGFRKRTDPVLSNSMSDLIFKDE